MKRSLVNILSQAQIGCKCPVCGCSKLWVKDIIKIDKLLYIQYKCDKCAYVPTVEWVWIPLPEGIDIIPGDYAIYGHITLDGKVYNDEYRLIGHDFWQVPKFKPKKRIICPKCQKEMQIEDIRPFIRREGQYRVDVVCRCENCRRMLAFGVHITEKEYKKLKNIKHIRNVQIDN